MTEENLLKRLLYHAEKVEEVLPSPSSPPRPWRWIEEKAAEVAAANGLREQPFYKKAKNPEKRFKVYVRNNRGRIRKVLQEDRGVMLEFGHDPSMKGIRRAGKKGAEKTSLWMNKVVDANGSSNNDYADSARKLLDVPAKSFQLRLYLPK